MKNKIYNYSIYVSCLFVIAHAISLPLLLYHDSFIYLHLSKIIIQKSQWTEWYFLRTPLFPISILTFVTIFGENAMTLITLTTCLGLIGVLLLGETVRRVAGPLSGAISNIILINFPLLIVYQHTLLMETGLFLFLSSLIFILSKNFKEKYLYKALWVVGILTIGFYWKPTLLYLSFPVAFLFILEIAISSSKSILGIFRSFLKLKSILLFFFIILVPNILAYPWNRMPEVKRASQGFVLAGSVIQAVIPADHRIISDWKEKYESAIKEKTFSNGLELGGIIGTKHFYAILFNVFEKAGDKSLMYFFEVILNNPKQYFHGLYNNLSIALLPVHDGDESIPYIEELRRNHETLFSAEVTVPQFKEANYNLSHRTGITPLNKILPYSMRSYKVLVRISWLTTFFLLAIGIWKRKPVYIYFSVLSLSYAAIHILPLISSARYLFPSFCVNLVGMVLFFDFLVKETFKKKFGVVK